MKNFTLTKFASLLVLSLVVMVGCSKEQSSISPEDMPKTATIIGSYTYDEGQEYDGSDYVRLIKPAARVEVEITVPVSDYSLNGEGQGVVTYYAVTDADGRFEISIKIPDQGVTATVKPADFKGVHHLVTGVDDGEPVCVTKEVVYTAEEQELDLVPNTIAINDVLYTCDERKPMEEYSEYSEFLVKVGEATYSKKKDEDEVYYIHQSYEFVEDVDVVISVAYEDTVLKYVALTDDEGVATFNIPTKELNWNTIIGIEARPYVVDSFTFYTEEYNEESGENEIVKKSIQGGIFQQVNMFETEVGFVDIEGNPVPVRRVKMNFYPFDGVETYGYSEYDWYGIEF